MSFLPSGVIDNYIQRVTELSQSTNRIPSAEELEKIATDLGIGPEELQLAQKQAQDHFVRAQGYAGLKYWDDAIEELQEAIAFNPGNVDMLLALSQAHLGRWQLKHQREDEEQVKLRVRQCLMVQPDSQAALNVLNNLTQWKIRRKQGLIGLALFTGAAIAGVLGVLFWQGGLPYVIQKRDRIEAIEKQFNGEILTLKQTQEQLKKDIAALENRQSQSNQEQFNRLQSQINQLEQALQRLQQQSTISPQPSP
ncbi:MAG: hypothetical protein VKJ02_10155 [Snowella sp.]|nr:hypothetical protein [Snowella sp.]